MSSSDTNSSTSDLQGAGRPNRPRLRLEHSGGEWTSDVVLDDSQSKTSSMTSYDSHRLDVNKTNFLPPQAQHLSQLRSPKQPKSPCFVHSLLDKGVSFQEWLQQTRAADIGVAKSLSSPENTAPMSDDMLAKRSSYGSSFDKPLTELESLQEEDFDEETDDFEGTSSLTRQLAETAVGVREMSKQLGRARVKANIQSVIIITKARDNRLIKLTRELALYLMLTARNGTKRGLIVYVDAQLRTSKRFDAEGIERDYPELFVPSPKRRSSSNTSLSSLSAEKMERDRPKDERGHGLLRYWTSEMCSRNPELFDFVVTLGGDGTVLFTSWLFQRIVPPVLPFALGSLGFLTNFDFADHQPAMDSAIDSGIRVNLRMRFTCTVYRAIAPERGKGRKAIKKAETGEIMMKNIGKEGWEALEGGWAGSGNVTTPSSRDKEIMCFTTRAAESFEVLNELVVDRGPSPYVSLLELFGDEHHMTTVQADGLTVSTPTGSTAYSLSAGGSLVHPEIPALLITPICPHTLSFRPMLLPDSMELRICVPYNSRSTAWASFDGRGRVELKQGDHIKVTASKYPFPTVCADKQSTDWFHAISRTLKWNERQRQKSFVVVEESSKPSRRKPVTGDGTKASEDGIDEEDENDVEEEEEEEEVYDIDTEKESVEADDAAEKLAKRKSMEEHSKAKSAVAAMMRNNSLLSNSGYSSSGIDSPNRFAGPVPHPRPLSPRHRVALEDASVHQSVLSSPKPDERRLEGETGDRDDIRGPRTAKESSKSKIPSHRDLDLENVRTPRPHEHYPRHPEVPRSRYQEIQSAHPLHQHHHRHHHHHLMPAPNRRTRSLSFDRGASRAFAVWGHDESDSNTSDSDSQY
ncbi:hypothetical protein Clacol_000486 [Clathrus columnatus]|uniref:NAD(+) kinase n=1 Tax=Clathrus columnatus TaxID=1419009 RepID=A0AAV5A335_9AGAM|nr:hypothetical protein Clacol_000486 [Clathrus columnatus]